MKHAQIIILVILVTIFVSFIGYWFNKNFEYVSEIVEIGFQGKARDNPLLAAKRLLEDLGTPVNTVQYFPYLNQQDTLVLVDPGFIENENQQLRPWIKNGGHLIIASDEPLLSAFDILFLDKTDDAIINTEPTKFIWNNYPLHVAFDQNYYIETQHDYAYTKTIRDKDGIHFLSVKYGTGILTILSDIAFIKNDKIGDYDHAYFLWQLVEDTVEDIWLWYSLENNDEEFPSLWILLWRNIWTVIISSTILLLFWLWLASRRFGPLLPSPPRARRRLLEHIEASGHFLWRHKQGDILLQSAKQALLKRIELVHPDWSSLSPSELSQTLAQISGLQAKDIEIALLSKNKNKLAFTQTIQIFSKIRHFL